MICLFSPEAIRSCSIVSFTCLLSSVSYRLFFIACFSINSSDKTVLSESKRSSITGSFHPCSSHVLKIFGTPLPARSPIFIRLNIFITDKIILNRTFFVMVAAICQQVTGKLKPPPNMMLKCPKELYIVLLIKKTRFRIRFGKLPAS